MHLSKFQISHRKGYKKT